MNDLDLMTEIENLLGIRCTPITWPIGMGKRFKGVYDLRHDRTHLFSATHGGRIQTGEVIEVHCTYDPATRGGDAPDGRKVKSTLHWVSAGESVEAEVRLYDRLFAVEFPDREDNFLTALNPSSLEILQGCRLEPSLVTATPGHRVQFERQGYFCLDTDSKPDCPVFNRTIELRDSWAKVQIQS